MNHLDVREKLVRRWDHVMCDMDRLPGEAVFQPTIEARACYLALLQELARAAAAARDELAAQVAEDLGAVGHLGLAVANVGTLTINDEGQAVIR